MRTTVLPSLCRSFRSSITAAPVFESSAPVGSSAKTMSGLVTSALAIATRCCCPPDKRFLSKLSLSPRPNWVSIWVAALLASLVLLPWYSSGAITFSIAVVLGSS